MTPMLHRVLVCLSLVAAAVGAPSAALAADWPERPLRLIVPFSAGSSSDTIARIVAARLAEHLGQQVVVDNRFGGSTVIGTDAVAKSPPDGYTLGLANATTHAASAALTQNLPFDPVADFAPVALIGSSPFVLVASPQLSAATLEDAIALAKARPGALSYASAGTGTLAHLAGELFRRKAGIEITHIPYRGTAQSTLDLMQGRIDLSVSTIAPTLEHIRAGRLRALAVMAGARNAMLPEVPTVGEAGVPGCEAALWTALVVPARVPADIVARLHAAMVAVVGSPDVQDSLRIQGVDPEPGPPAAVARLIAADLAKWREVAATAHITEAK